MPANRRWDLIQRLKGQIITAHSVVRLGCVCGFTTVLWTRNH